MITGAHLVNFQAHADTTVHFDVGLNCFIGDSDKGKTAILRAVYWVLHNRPGGTSIIRSGQEECTVEIFVDYKGKQHTVKRVRSKSKNQYWLQDQLFDVVGRDVPA